MGEVSGLFSSVIRLWVLIPSVVFMWLGSEHSVVLRKPVWCSASDAASLAVKLLG